MGAETRASQRSALAAYYDWLLDTGRRTERSPLRGMPAVRRPMGVPRPCPDSVVVEGLAFADTATQRAIILARFAGLRAGEIAAVSAGDVTDDERLRVYGKGGRVRLVPLPAAVRAALTGCPTGWVFPGRFDGHMRRRRRHRFTWRCPMTRCGQRSRRPRRSGHG